MWFDLPAPAVIAHRGASTHAPENTLAAFELAVRQGADAIEFDVKLAADGQVVILHDATVDRTTNGTGKVSRLSLTALRELDAGSWFAEQFRGERIPTLDEVLEAVGKRILLNIELTNYATPLDDLVSKVAMQVKKFGLEGQVLFSSFFPHNLLKAARLIPKVPRGLLAWAGWMGWWARAFGFRSNVYQALHPYFSDVTPGLVERLHSARRKVHVWTVNAETDIKRMIDYDVDAIFTDDSALACRLLGEHRDPL